MKILYISNYGDGSGYANAATGYILSIDEIGLQIVPRRIQFNDANQVHSRIQSLENNSVENCDIVIQHTLPSYMDYNGNFKKNIALFAWETSNFKKSNWKTKLNCMDEIWVPSRFLINSCVESGVTKPIKVVPHAVDTNKFYQKRQILDFVKEIKEKNDGFIFYTIGEFNVRKNFESLIKAFHLEFEPHEPVELVIKTGIEGKPPDEVYLEIDRYLNQIKSNLKLYRKANKYKKEYVITARMKEDAINNLHYSADCFVTTSYGDAWNLGCMDALGFGKTPIVPASSGFLDYVSNKEGYLVNCKEEPVYGVQNFVDLYTGHENWWSVDINHLRKCMRLAFESRNDIKHQNKQEFGKNKVFDYSYLKVGQIIKDLL